MRLAEATDAAAIILFGSRARGDNDDESDWDLCVILPDNVEWGRFTPITLWPLVSDLGIPIQVVPIRRSVFEEKKTGINTLSHDIARDVANRDPRSRGRTRRSDGVTLMSWLGEGGEGVSVARHERHLFSIDWGCRASCVPSRGAEVLASLCPCHENIERTKRQDRRSAMSWLQRERHR